MLDIRRWHRHIDLFAVGSLALYFFWAGAMKFFAFEQATISSWLGKHALLGELAPSMGTAAAYLLGAAELAIALLLMLGFKQAVMGRAGALLALLLSVLSLTLLFTNPVWIDALGGFPAIGSGQGVIKYLSFAGVAWYLANYFQGQATGQSPSQQGALVTILLGLVLVLGWIGGMKFTLIEAEGIADLLPSSPVLFWLPLLFDTQGASNFIGVLELVTVAALLMWFRGQSLWFTMGALLAVATFLTTLSFMVTAPGWHGELGFPYIGNGGQFLLRDLVMLAGTLLLMVHPAKR